MSVLPAAEAKFDYEIPVVIIGAGACGLCAALAATENGAEVLVLERDEKPTGSTALSTGMIPAAGTKLQAQHGVDDTAEIFAADLMAKAKQKTDPVMARAIAEASGPTVDWLMESHDVVLTLVEGFLYPGHSKYRMHGTPHRSGKELSAALLAATGRKGIDIVGGAMVEDLYADGGGRVGAVRFRRPDGTLETVGCKALVLACNGFGGNKEMLRRYIPEIAEADYMGHVGNTGDAIRWGSALGAATADLGSYQGHGSVAHPYGNTMNYGLISAGGFQVNSAGERFSNEASGYSEQAVEVVKQPGRVAWEIFDEIREKLVRGFTDYEEVLALGGIKRANTIEELARALGLPEAAVAGSLAEVEASRASGKADRFGRVVAGDRLVPPFCAVKITGALYHTQGGLVVDPSARVLREDRSRLPNLFAGGGAARGLSGPSRWGYLSGNGLLTATTLGRAAGLSAAALVRG
ncbi:MAG: FAD-dependent oxidoreductase [Alphaproteobacteria bacterium]|nr:FAD-dependent oxidoreductase [Alphaproteobacteria bacterium]